MGPRLVYGNIIVLVGSDRYREDPTDLGENFILNFTLEGVSTFTVFQEVFTPFNLGSVLVILRREVCNGLLEGIDEGDSGEPSTRIRQHRLHWVDSEGDTWSTVSWGKQVGHPPTVEGGLTLQK